MSRPSLSELRSAVQAGPPYAEEFLALLEADSRAGARVLHTSCLRRIERAEVAARHAENMLVFEREAQARGFARVAGVDEAGRGPLAGPIVAAAVVLAEPVPGLNDSKQLTEAQRETLFDQLYAGAHTIGCVAISAAEIDATGIQAANYGAMVRSVAFLEPAADFALIDGFAVPDCPVPQERIIKGDARSQSIAAASIVAKVTRDRYMAELDERYPGYGFAQHKGYGTAGHLEALERLGPCPDHRHSFAPVANLRGAATPLERIAEAT